MNKTIGRLLAVGNVAEVFEWGPRVVKLYKSTASKPAAFREAALHAAAEELGLPVPRVWSVQEVAGRWGVVFDQVKQASFAEQMLHNANEVPRYLECMVRLHMRFTPARRPSSPVSRTGLQTTLLQPNFSMCSENMSCSAELPRCQTATACAMATFTRCTCWAKFRSQSLLIGPTLAGAILRQISVDPTY